MLYGVIDRLLPDSQQVAFRQIWQRSESAADFNLGQNAGIRRQSSSSLRQCSRQISVFKSLRAKVPNIPARLGNTASNKHPGAIEMRLRSLGGNGYDARHNFELDRNAENLLCKIIMDFACNPGPFIQYGAKLGL